MASAMVLGLTMSLSVAPAEARQPKAHEEHKEHKEHGDQRVDGKKQHKVTLCHATHSDTNPYVLITVDYHSVVKGGHGGHEGPIYSPSLPKHTPWGDIIPPFDFGPSAQYPGMNWAAEGQVLMLNDCRLPAATTLPPTTQPPATTPPTTTPTTVAPTTTVPTTTTTVPATTTTTVPATTTTTVAETTTTTTPTSAAVLSNQVTKAATPGATTTAPSARVLGVSVVRDTATATGALPVTGFSGGVLAILGVLLLGAGVVLVLRTRRAASV